MTPPANGLNPSQAMAPPANGLNPAHGLPGHRCDIPVGKPLNSKPQKSAQSPVIPAKIANDSAKS
jgi:hypothetical protein